MPKLAGPSVSGRCPLLRPARALLRFARMSVTPRISDIASHQCAVDWNGIFDKAAVTTSAIEWFRRFDDAAHSSLGCMARGIFTMRSTVESGFQSFDECRDRDSSATREAGRSRKSPPYWKKWRRCGACDFGIRSTTKCNRRNELPRAFGWPICKRPTGRRREALNSSFGLANFVGCRPCQQFVQAKLPRENKPASRAAPAEGAFSEARSRTAPSPLQRIIFRTPYSSQKSANCRTRKSLRWRKKTAAEGAGLGSRFVGPPKVRDDFQILT